MACPAPAALVESQACNPTVCAVDCAVGAWSAFSACNVGCGKGFAQATRSVTTQVTPPPHSRAAPPHALLGAPR